MRMPSKASRRFAQALFEAAREAGELSVASIDMECLGSALEASRELPAVLGDYQIPLNVRARLLAALFEARVSSLVWRFLLLMEQNRRLGLLSMVIESFLQMAQRATGVMRVTVTEAFAGDDARRSAMQSHIQAVLGKPVEMTMAVDGGLMGGFLFRAEDTIYDSSVAGQLLAFKKNVVSRLASTPVSRG